MGPKSMIPGRIIFVVFGALSDYFAHTGSSAELTPEAKCAADEELPGSTARGHLQRGLPSAD